MAIDSAVSDEGPTRAAQWLSEADGVLITAGAGMGVDSGLPDFRGTDGFWRAYRALYAEGIHFEDIANPVAFRHDSVCRFLQFSAVLGSGRRTKSYPMWTKLCIAYCHRCRTARTAGPSRASTS